MRACLFSERLKGIVHEADQLCHLLCPGDIDAGRFPQDIRYGFKFEGQFSAANIDEIAAFLPVSFIWRDCVFPG